MRKNIYMALMMIVFLGGMVDAAAVRPTSQRVLTLAGTADLQGWMEAGTQDYKVEGHKQKMLGGGIVRIANAIQKVRAANPEGTLVVSSGDDLMGRYFHAFDGAAIYTLMSQSGYEIYAPGNHEFDRGSAVFSHALSSATFTTLCSDLAVSGTVLEGKCAPETIVHLQGAKIGIFSLMTEDFPRITSPGNVRLKAPNLAVAKRSIERLQAAKCDIIIALTHIGLKQDIALARQVEGIDVIFGGHSHRYTKKLVPIKDTLIVNGGEQGSYVLKLTLPLDGRHRIQKGEASLELIPTNQSVPKSSGVAKRLRAYQKKLPPTTILGTTTIQWDLTTHALRRSESRVADLVNDLLRRKFGVDIVLNNAGAFRGKKVYFPGNITDTMLHEIDAFSNNAYTLKLRGKYLRSILEHSATQYGRGGLMQVSGLRYAFDRTRPAQKIRIDGQGHGINCPPLSRPIHLFS